MKTIGGRSFGKQYKLFTEFLTSIRSGDSAMIFGSDYVVMDRKTYDELKSIETKFNLTQQRSNTHEYTSKHNNKR